MDEQCLADAFNPVFRSAGLVAIGAAGLYGGYHKLRQSVGGKSPTETAITNLLPQAFSRAALATFEANKTLQAQLLEVAGIDVLKAALRTATTREEKVGLWTEIALQSYALMLVAPHLTSALIVAISVRGAVGILAHLQQSSGMRLDDSGDNLMACPTTGKKSIVRTFLGSIFSGGGAKTAITEAMMGHLTSLLGTNAFAVDDADNANAEAEGNAVSPLSFGQSEIVELLCAAVPSLMRAARLCLMEQLGMVSADALPSILEATGRGGARASSSSVVLPPTAASSSPAPAPSLIDVTQSAALCDVEAAVWRAHGVFFTHCLDWEGGVFGSSAVLFPELAAMQRRQASQSGLDDEFAEDAEGGDADEDGAGGHSGTLAVSPAGGGAPPTTFEEMFGFGAQGPAPFGFQPTVDPLVADGFRMMTRRYMQDLLTGPDVGAMLRGYGLANFRYWWGVTFFHTDIAAAGPAQSPSAAASPSASPKAAAHEGDAAAVAVPIPLSEPLRRAAERCKSLDVSTSTVRLLEFALSVDRSRQALLMSPFAPDGSSESEGQSGLFIPLATKAFCEELVRASGPRQ